jgi:hypothetical protein
MPTSPKNEKVFIPITNKTIEKRAPSESLKMAMEMSKKIQ